ncbi:response regulator [Virgibacillus siamensis]|uniref:Response regulator n=1 Tax=Virgibacillus siamensis TaxID=480071 RepID=A0ABN1FJP6_9BACI
MKILIAEDELLERKAMRKFLEDNFNELEEISEAANGREAIEQAAIFEPDIIFMDIKMPGINGLEAIEKIQNTLPSIKFILVSAYDSFDFAKQAMHYGVKEYILKPGKKTEIVASILRVKKELAYEAKEMAEKRSLIEERFISKLMQHQSFDKEGYHLLKEYFPTFQCGYFLVLQQGDPVDEADVRTKLDKHIEHPFIVNPADGRVTCCVLASSALNKSEILMQARKIQLEFGDCFLGLGYAYSTMESLSKSYHEALTAMYQLTRQHNRKYGFVEVTEEKDNRMDVIVQLLDEMEKGNEHESARCFTENRELFSPDDLEELYFNVKQLMEEHHLSLPDSSITELKSDESWQQFITLCCLTFQEYYQSNQLMEKVKDYIDEHYKDGITLEEMAEHVGLSPNYFSNVFKKAFGNTFVEYVTEKRMKEAKYLLMENDYSLKEICYMLGYHDPNYFSRVFKKHYSMSPKKYQQEIFKK